MKIKYFTDMELDVKAPVTVPVHEDKVEYAEVDKIVKTGDGENDFIIEKQVVEVSRVDLDEYINSFRDDVGLANILKKVQLTGDNSLLNVVPGYYGDESLIPQTPAEAQKIVDEGKAAAESLGIDFTKEAIQKYIDAELAKIKAAQDAAIKEDVNNG